MRAKAVAIPAVIAVLLSLLLVARVPGQGVWHAVLLNALHGPIFGAVAVLLLLARPPEARATRNAHLVAFLAAVALGIMVEVLQTMGKRPGTLFDVYTDAAGAAAGLGLWKMFAAGGAAALQRKRTSRGWLPLAMVLAGVAFISWYPLQAALAYVHRAANFPSIAEFRGPRDLAFVKAEGASVAIEPLPGPWGRNDDRGLRVRFDARHSPAVQVVEPTADWRGYSVIAVDLTNPAPREIRLTLRILDEHHDWSHEDRLNLPLTVPPQTRTTLRVSLQAVEDAPAGRRMDLSRIRNVMLFGRTAAEPSDLYVSRIWLE